MQRVSSGVCLVWLFSISVLVPFGVGQQSIPPQADRPLAPYLPGHDNKPTDRALSIAYKDGRLTVDVQGHTLQRLVSEISDRTGVVVILDDAVAAQLISIRFQGLSLDEGLRRILKNNDTFYFYGAEKGGSSALNAVWVYPKGKGQGLQPVSPDKWASTKELERMLNDPDPQVRGQAIETLVERKREAALDLVLNSLGDTDDQVRIRALYGAEKAGVTVPEGVLNSLVASDASPDVRFLALQALANSPNAKAVAEAALDDPSEPVRQEAQEILAHLGSAKQSQAPTETPQTQPNPMQY